MNTDQWNEEELRELRKVFFAQAREILADLQDLALKLEGDPGNGEALRTVKRHVHTLKGDANAMGLTAAGTLCHRFEDVLAPVLDNKEQLNHDAIDLLLAAVDGMETLMRADEAGEKGGRVDHLIARIDRYLGSSVSQKKASSRAQPAQLTEYQKLEMASARESGQNIFDITVELHPLCAEKTVALRMLMQRLSSAGRIIRVEPEPDSPAVESAASFRFLAASSGDAVAVEQGLSVAGISNSVHVAAASTEPTEQPNDEHQPAAPVSAPQADTVRVETSKVDRIMDLVGELIIGRSMMEQTVRELEEGLSPADAAAQLFSVNAYFDRTVADLKKSVMKLRMIPINHVFRKFPKLIRDLALERAKSVRLDIRGRETELDKSIVDALGEPLAHIIRNLIDHGIETAQERRSSGKPEEGVILLRAFQEGSHFVVEASDDGRGIDLQKVKSKAVEQGSLGRTEADAMNDKEAMHLIFLPGLSTAEVVSDTSGRGVGMDAVRASVEALKGTIEIESARGKGTLFRIRLPLTLAVVKALLFKAGGKQYALPVSVISEVSKVNAASLVSVDGKKTLLLREEVVSVVDLGELFHAGQAPEERKYALIIGFGGRRIAILIDRLLWQQELVIKAVDETLVSSPCIAGASILGDGQVVLILDEQALIKKAIFSEKEKRLA